MGESPPLPEHSQLRVLAQVLEDISAAAEILDHKWRVVFTSTEDALSLGFDPAAMVHHYGKSLVVRPDDHPAFAIPAAGPPRSCSPTSRHPASWRVECPLAVISS